MCPPLFFLCAALTINKTLLESEVPFPTNSTSHFNHPRRRQLLRQETRIQIVGLDKKETFVSLVLFL